VKPEPALQASGFFSTSPPGGPSFPRTSSYAPPPNSRSVRSKRTRSRSRSRFISIACFAQIIITSWRAEVRAARRCGSSPRYERSPSAGHSGTAAFRPLRGDARRPARGRLLADAAGVRPRYLHLGSRRCALCEVVGLASPASGGHPDRDARTFTRDRGAVAGRARP
jgi:hypothetical protein